jgi:hypothetical protein
VATSQRIESVGKRGDREQFTNALFFSSPFSLFLWGETASNAMIDQKPGITGPHQEPQLAPEQSGRVRPPNSGNVSLKERRQDFVKILLPDRISMGASGYTVNVLDFVFRELLRKVPYRVEQRILKTATDP